jgi:hypothetical protein
MIIKLDMANAFDGVRHSFLLAIFKKIIFFYKHTLNSPDLGGPVGPDWFLLYFISYNKLLDARCPYLPVDRWYDVLVGSD